MADSKSVTPQENDAALALLRHALGTQTTAPTEGAGEHLKSLQFWHPLRDYPSVSGSDLFKAAVDSLVRQYPAAKYPNYSEEKLLPGVGGQFHAGNIYVSPDENTTYPQIMSTLRHELSHRLGALDATTISPTGLYPRHGHKDYGSYDVGDASTATMSDIELPPAHPVDMNETEYVDERDGPRQPSRRRALLAALKRGQ